MARIACTTILIILLNVLVSCSGTDSGRGQIVTSSGRRPAPIINMADTGETDLIEQMVVSRQAYQRGLELLIAFYEKTGNNMKLQWARKELGGFHSMPKYNYIIEANIVQPGAGPNASIPEADDLYYQAMQLKREAGPLPVLKDENKLRLALTRFNDLIKSHPTSDKIDDAAFEAGDIYEHFKDYSIALLYFKRTFEWDPNTAYAARFRAARILDWYLHRNSEALELYQEAIKTEGRLDRYREWKEFAQKRVDELQQPGTSLP